MTLPAQDIVEWLRSSASRLDYAGDGLGYYTRADAIREREAADTISRLTADNEALRKDNARLSEEKEALAFGMRHGQSLSEDAIHAIRELLNEAGVPLAAFIDDHVGNAIVQRDQARAKGTALDAEVGRLREALKPFATYLDTAKYDLDNLGRPLPDDLGMGWVYLTVGNFRRARAALANEEAGG